MEMLEITDTLDRQSRQLRLQNLLALAIALLLAAIGVQLYRIHPIKFSNGAATTDTGPNTGLIPDEMIAMQLPLDKR